MALKKGYQQLKMKVNLKILIEENLIEKNVELCLNHEKNSILQEISVTKIYILKPKFLNFESRESFTA